MKGLSKKQLDDMGKIGGVEYARQEAWDIVNAAQALGYIAQLCINEADEPDDIKSLVSIGKGLTEFINGEFDEMAKASRRGESYEKAAPAQARGKEDPKGELNLSYVKSLGIAEIPSKLAVKFTAMNEIQGYTFLWGSPKLTDVEIEYFTRDTNFWDGVLGKSARPLTWDHNQDETFKANPVIGQIVDWGDDEIGRWYVAKLDRSHRYNEAIGELIKQGKLGTSSDSAPQYVTRVKTGKATWLKDWAWFASALTDTPAEPRMIGSLEIIKSLGVQLPDTRAAWEWNRQRLLLSKIK